MKRALSHFSLVALAISIPIAASACGGQPPVVAPTPVASSASSASAPNVTASLGGDTSAVPEPQNLLVVGRVASAGKVLKTVHTWSQLPMPKDDAVTELLTTEAVGGLVDLDQSLDFAVAVTGSGTHIKEQIAFSAAVKDFEKAKVAFLEHFKLTLIDGGMLHVEGLGRAGSHADDDDDDDDDPRTPKKGGDKPKDDDNEDRRHCALAPAFGPASVRLVCAGSLGSLKALGPYLTRTVTRTNPSSDFNVQLRTGPVKQAITEQKSMIRGLASTLLGMRGVGRGVSDIAGAVGMDLADLALDLDTATLDAQIDDSGANLTLGAKFGGQTATLTKLATQHPERTDVAPASFWQLPGDAEIAMFHRGIEKTEFENGRDLFANAIGSQLSTSGITDPERQGILDAFKKMTSGSAAVFAAGLDASKTRRAFADQRQLDRYNYSRGTTADSAKFEARRAAAEAILGWTVFGIDDAAAKTTSAARDLVAAWNKPKVTTALRSKRKDGPIPEMRIGAALKGMPKDTLHVEIDLYPYLPPVASTPATPPKPTVPKPGDKPKPPEEKPKPIKPLRVHMLIVPDGAAHTWIVLAADEAVAIAKATAVMGSSPDGDKLAKRAGLDSLRTMKIGAGGFITQRGVPTFSQRLSTLNGTFTGVGEHFDDMTAQSHGGTTPIVFGFTAQQGNQMTATTQLPRAAIEDFVVTFIKRVSGG